MEDNNIFLQFKVLYNIDLLIEISDYLTDNEAFNIFNSNKIFTNIITKFSYKYKVKRFVDEIELFYLSYEKKYKIQKIKNVIDSNILYTGITHVIFNDKYNNKPYLPETIKYIQFGSHFNQPLDNLPKQLIKLILGTYFNQPLDNLPEGLKELQLGTSLMFKTKRYKMCNFNNLIDNLPDSLEYLELGHKFNKTINKLPKNLKILKLGYEFNSNINNLPDKRIIY